MDGKLFKNGFLVTYMDPLLGEIKRWLSKLRGEIQYEDFPDHIKEALVSIGERVLHSPYSKPREAKAFVYYMFGIPDKRLRSVYDAITAFDTYPNKGLASFRIEMGEPRVGVLIPLKEHPPYFYASFSRGFSHFPPGDIEVRHFILKDALESHEKSGNPSPRSVSISTTWVKKEDNKVVLSNKGGDHPALLISFVLDPSHPIEKQIHPLLSEIVDRARLYISLKRRK